MLVLPLPGIAVLSWGVVILGGVKHKEKNYEDMVGHQSAVRSRDLRNDPDLSASNATWCRTERRWGEGHHLRARPSSPAAGGKTRVSTRATRSPSRLLILFERQRRYSEIGERLLEGLPSVAREPISAAGSIRPNGGWLPSSPITGNNVIKSAGIKPVIQQSPPGIP
jgi:hypothetical protein